MKLKWAKNSPVCAGYSLKKFREFVNPNLLAVLEPRKPIVSVGGGLEGGRHEHSCSGMQKAFKDNYYDKTQISRLTGEESTK